MSSTTISQVNVCVGGSILRSLEVSVRECVESAVRRCASEYDFDGDAAMLLMSFESSVVGKVVDKVKSVKSVKV